MNEKIELCKESDCTQCFACLSVCPRTCIIKKEVDGGFWIPEIRYEDCISCQRCVKSCHVLSPKRIKKKPYITLAAWNENDLVRKKSSSGGVFSVLADLILDKGGVVFGAAFVEGLQLVHIGVESKNELGLLRGSKYVQSDLSTSYRQTLDYLKGGRKVLFTGTPCQIAGLYAFLKIDYENLYTCDLICHGVPSQKAFDCYLKKIGITPKPKDYFNFRYTDGWGFQLAYNGKKISAKKMYYLRAFNRGLMFMESCYTCKYATPDRISDITLADYWDIGSIYPFKHPTQKGISMVLINTLKGESLLDNCSDIYREERSLDEAIKCNHNLSKPSYRPKDKGDYYKDSLMLSVFELVRKYSLQPSLRDYLRPLKWKINRFLNFCL